MSLSFSFSAMAEQQAALLAEMAKVVKQQLETQLAPVVESNEKMANALAEVQKAVSGHTQQINETITTVTSLATQCQQLDSKVRQTDAAVAEMKKTMDELRLSVERAPKQVRVDSTASASSGAAPAPPRPPAAGAVQQDAPSRPTSLQVRGFSRGHYEADYQDYWLRLKARLPDHLVLDCEPSYPHCQNYFTLKFSTNDNAFRAKGLLTASDLPGFDDTRRHKVDKPFITFTRTAQEASAGRYRSFFYAVMKAHIETLPLAQGKTVKMKVVTQKLIADIEGDPYELVRIVLTKTGEMRVTPLYDSCSDIGMDAAMVDELVAKATKQADEDRASR